jgi:hypothetical protein
MLAVVKLISDPGFFQQCLKLFLALYLRTTAQIRPVEMEQIERIPDDGATVSELAQRMLQGMKICPSGRPNDRCFDV